MNLITRRSIACSIVGVGVLDDPHIFNADNACYRNYELCILHYSLFPMPCAAYAVRSTLCALFSALIKGAQSVNLTTQRMYAVLSAPYISRK